MFVGFVFLNYILNVNDKGRCNIFLLEKKKKRLQVGTCVDLVFLCAKVYNLVWDLNIRQTQFTSDPHLGSRIHDII